VTEPTKPNLFIVGAPKAATTALNDWLAEHPEVFMCPKEVHYFGRDLLIRSHRPTAEEYAALFRNAGSKRVIGDASVSYLYSRSAPAEIHAYAPEAKIIAAVRNPVDLLYSHHRQMLLFSNENIEDFEEALAAEEERKRGERIPKTCNSVHDLFYRDIVGFSEQLERYFEIFGRGSVHVIVFDDLARDPANTYREVLRFLGVDESYQPEFRVVNPSSRPRSRTVSGALHQPPTALRKLARTALPSRRLRIAVSNRLFSLNRAVEPPPPLDPRLRRRLENEFAPEVARLGVLIGRDLSTWSVPAEPPAR
jgi:hypothetical protein